MVFGINKKYVNEFELSNVFFTIRYSDTSYESPQQTKPFSLLCFRPGEI